MERNMRLWIKEQISAEAKKAMPVLSFSGGRLIGVSVEELVKDGHLQAMCMKSIAEKYPQMGIAVSLMDLSVEAEAFGADIVYSEDEVPTVHGTLIETPKQAEALRIPEVGDGRTGECVKGIREACEQIIDRPVFAGMIGPYSLAGRLLDMTEIMILCYEDPDMVTTVLEKVTSFLIPYAKALKQAGANGILLAEPAAGLLSPALIQEFSNPYVKQIREAVEDETFIVMYHNCGNVVPQMNQIQEVDAAAYSFGNAIDIEKALQAIPSDRIVVGNIDPAGTLRNGTPETVRKETMQLLERCSKYPNFIISSGCDIPPMTPFENMDAFFDTVQEFYQA